MLSTSAIVLRTPFYPFAIRDLRRSFEVHHRTASFKEALYLSSPHLAEEFERNESSLTEEMRISLYKYFLRMSFRCTPFGMFSGTTAGKYGQLTSFILCGQQLYNKHTRLDNYFINSFIQKCLSYDQLKNAVNWFTNNTVYHIHNTVRYIEYRLSNSQRSHHLAKVEASVYLNRLLEKAQTGAKINDLVGSIVSEEITPEEAALFIDELIESRLLVSELEPPVTGEEPYKALLHVLAKYDAANVQKIFLEKLITQIQHIESSPPGTDIHYYKEVVKVVKDWDPEYDPRFIFQSDLKKPAHKMEVSVSVLDDLKDAIAFLSLLNGPAVHANLNKFKEEFVKRYEHREMPLLQVLDAESGIGYPPIAHSGNDEAPLLQPLRFNSASSTTNYQVSAWQKKLIPLYYQCLADQKTELKITDDHFSIDKGLFNDGILADSFSTTCSIVGTEDEIASNQFIIDYRGSMGPSSANLLGRFCYSDESIHAIVKELVQKEEQLHPDKIFAEVVHLAQTRVGNVLIRPSLRTYEIPILTCSAVDEEHTIRLEDLLVSVKNDRVVLWSKKLNKEVIPRNTTAHNYAGDTIPYYHFLCDVPQQDNRVRLNWDWGMLNEFPFLPRITYGRVVLSKARWIVDLNELKISSECTISQFKKTIENYRIINRLPEQVVLTHGDNQLPLNLHDTLCVAILKQELTRNKRIILEECLFNETNLVAIGPEGRFTHEIIVPWTRTNKIETKPERKARVSSETARQFVPGSEWHYIKIYCGVKTSDRVLTDVVKPLADELIKKQAITQWFFIRYNDPDYHLRIRFKGSALFFAEVTECLNQLLLPFLNNGLTWKIQTDTYERELERYGNENIENTEVLFFHDSVASVEVLKLLDGDQGDQVRWLFALKGINDLLDDFGFNLDDKEELMIVFRDGFKREFNAVDTQSQKKLSEHYRKCRKEVELILSPSIDSDHDYIPVWEIFKQRREDWSATIAAIKEKTDITNPGVALKDLIGSYIHMFVNRFMRSKQRMHELVLYDFLCQYYRSTRAQEKKTRKTLVESNNIHRVY